MKLFKPGFICKVEDNKKTVAWVDESPYPPGKIQKVPEPLPENLPIFTLLSTYPELTNPYPDHRYDDHISTFEHFFSFTLPNPCSFSETVLFSPINYTQFVLTYTYKPRKNLISSISFIVKKSVFTQLCEMNEQRNHVKFTSKKYHNTHKNYLKEKSKLELNLKPEYDLSKEKERLNELIRANRPFLNVGFTGVKTSKHAVCVERQKKSNIKEKIEEKTHALEIQLNMAQSIMEKNLKIHTFKMIHLTVTYTKNIESLVSKANKRSLFPIVFYTFSAWIAHTKLKKEKRTCIELAKSAIGLFKLLKTFQNWRRLSEKPKKMERFYEDVSLYTYKRKLSRLFISWRWFRSYKKLKDLMSILAHKLYREKLKLKKFLELKTEVKLVKGTRVRYQTLAKGEDSTFDREELMTQAKFSFTVIKRRLLSSLSKYKEAIFLQAQESLSVQKTIYSGEYYKADCRNWKAYLHEKYRRN